MVEILCESLAATAELGRRLAAALFADSVVALVGPMGAGKTHFARAVVEGLDGDGRRVSSPTFGLIHEYAARLPVFHFDTYRLRDEAAFVDLGVDEYFAAGGVCLVEWADRVTAALPEDRLVVAIELVDDTTRRFVLSATGPRHSAIVASVSRGP